MSFIEVTIEILCTRPSEECLTFPILCSSTREDLCNKALPYKPVLQQRQGGGLEGSLPPIDGTFLFPKWNNNKRNLDWLASSHMLKH